MADLLTIEMLFEWLTAVRLWLGERVLAPTMLLQVAVILAVLAAAPLAGRPVKSYLQTWFGERFKAGTRLYQLVHGAVQLVPVGVAIVMIWMVSLVIRQMGGVTFFLSIVQTLLLAWLTIKLASSVLLDRFWSRLVSTTAWILAALHIVGALGPALAFLDGLGFSIGRIHLSVLSLFKAAVVLLIMFHIGSWLGDMAERKLGTVQGLTPSTTVLLSKIIKIALFTVVFLVALNSLGIDFTALAVFSGAVGVGVGFGLQKVVGNFVSGIILLLDKSIKPGDVIQVGDVYGWIAALRGRFVSVVTRDGKEFLIPNEDLITHQVINWSFSDRKIRLKVPIGISYDADPHKAMELVVTAAGGMVRVLDDPAPVCRLMGFGDNSVDLELRFWIEDPQNGTMNVRSKILLKVWDLFKEHGIGIPYPQRDVHIDFSDAMQLGKVVSAAPDRT